MTVGDEVAHPASREPPPVALPQLPAPPTATRTRRRRRPSGAPPPLPKHIGTTGTGWLIAFGVLLLWAILAHNSTAVGGFTDRLDSAILRQVARLRTPWLTDVADAVESGFSFWLTTLATVALIVLLAVFKRWRHLFTVLGCMVAAAGASGKTMWTNFKRPRPYDVTIIGDWGGWSFPAPGVAVAALCVARVRLLDGRARAAAHRSPSAVAVAFVTVGSAARGCTSRPSIRSTSRWASPWRSRSSSTPSASSRRTRSSRSPTGGGKTAHLDVGGRAWRGDPAAPSRTSSGSTWSTSSRSASPARAARRRCGCGSPATPTPTCSGSSTR